MPRRATYNNFGESVSSALTGSGLTQSVLAAKLDVSVGYLNNTTVKDPTTNTPVNMNKPSITIGTDGSLTINNVSSAVTHLSFHEPGLPLYTG